MSGGEHSSHNENSDEDHVGPEVHEEHEGGHDEPWLVSYADMMTLLFGFFVIMYSFANAKNKDQDEWFKIKKELSTYFGGEYSNPVDAVSAALKKTIEAANLKNEIAVKVVGDTLELIMQSKVIFESGRAEIIETQKPLIEKLLMVIIDRKIANYITQVEGHTDDAPISNKYFRSNWDLSSARAATVAMMLQSKNYDPNLISVRAFAEFKPIVPNKSEDGLPIEGNRAKNRRVVIRLVPDKG